MSIPSWLVVGYFVWDARTHRLCGQRLASDAACVPVAGDYRLRDARETAISCGEPAEVGAVNMCCGV